MPKLTDTQLVILSAAAQREDGAALPLPKSLKIRGAAVNKTLEGQRKKGLIEEKRASRDAAVWREGKDGRRMMLVITEAGLRALGAEPGSETDPAVRKTSSTAQRNDSVGRTTDQRPKAETAPSAKRPMTKQSLLIDLLKRKSGSTIAEVTKATGWQAHSVRGAINGALKKKLGFAIASEKIEGRGRVYRIVEGS